MFIIKKKHIFRLLAIFTCGSLFLPIVFKNLPFPFHAPTFYFAIWIVALFALNPNIFFSKNLLYVYLFTIVFFLGIPLLWNDRVVGLGAQIDYIYIRDEIQWLFLALLMYSYFLKVKDYKGLALVVVITLSFALVTSITSIIGLIRFPGASRQLATGSMGDTQFFMMYHEIGIGIYGFFAGMAFIFPIFAYYIKRNYLNRGKKIILLGIILLIFLGMIKAEHTTIVFTAGLFFLFALFAQKSLKRTVIGMIFIGIFIAFVPVKQIAGIFYHLSGYVSGTDMEFRLNDLGRTIEFSDYDPRYSQTYTGSVRIALSYSSLVSFMKNPLIGGGDSSGHAFWLDRLALFGIIGIIPWFLILKQQIQFNLKFMSEDFKSYYLISMVAYISFGLVKGMGGPEVMTSVFFLAPGMYFLKYLLPKQKPSLFCSTPKNQSHSEYDQRSI